MESLMFLKAIYFNVFSLLCVVSSHLLCVAMELIAVYIFFITKSYPKFVGNVFE